MPALAFLVYNIGSGEEGSGGTTLVVLVNNSGVKIKEKL